MRRPVFAVLASRALFACGCSAFVASQLSGKQGSPANQKVGGCYNLPNNQCGACIAQNCEDPNGSPPVSLAAVCSFQSPDTYTVQDCANDSTVGYADNCSLLFKDGGTYASSLTQQSAAENNVRLCVRDRCMTSCRTCAPDVPYCNTDSTPLADAGACGACLNAAMNLPNSPCQAPLVQSDFGCESYIQTDIAACATPVGDTTCISPDCSGLQSQDAGVLGCLWQQCASSCPNY